MTGQNSKDSAPVVATVGLALVDHVYALDHLPTHPEKFFASNAKDVVGGIAANAALAAVNLGAMVKLIGRVGDDSSGQFIVDTLTKAGVDLSALRSIPGQVSPSSAVLVDSDGERLIVNHRSDELFANPPGIDHSTLEGVQAILADLRWLSGAADVFLWGSERNIPTILDFDLSSAESPDTVLALATHTIFGELALCRHTNTDDPKQGLLAVRAQYPKMKLAVTAGSNGVHFLNERDDVEHINAIEVTPVSTLGAGDVFHGAATVAIAEGKSFEDALKFANTVSALRVSNTNSNHFPDRKEVEQFKRTMS